MDQAEQDDRRPHDLVVWGATGYTGRLVALATARSIGDRPWAVGGRSRERLERLRAEIADLGGRVPEVVVASIDDADSMHAMTGGARVVLTTVGPYDLHGEPLIEAAIATGTHVADITGEVPWVRRMRTRHETAARAAGIRIVSMCGYDSVPSELGVGLLQQAAVESHGRPARLVETGVGPIRGGFSGGTAASAMNMAEQLGEPEIRDGLAGPWSLCVAPPDSPVSLAADTVLVRRATVLHEWTAPFIMSGVNTAVVHRTHELLGRPWGDAFEYRERSTTGAGFRGWLRACLLTLASGAVAAMIVVPPIRWLARRWVLPKPGQGPSETQLRDGFVRHRTVAEDPPVAVTFEVDMDPGYAATARMLLACGMALLEEDVDEAVEDAFCTPGAIFGPRLRPRLESMGFRISISTDEA